MHKLHLSIILFGLIILLPGCSAGNPIQLYQIDSGRVIKMNPGDTLEIVLDANPTTGYQWKALPSILKPFLLARHHSNSFISETLRKTSPP